MKLDLEVQRVLESAGTPSDDELRGWAEAALEGHLKRVELVIRIVDEAESRTLNRDYRGKDRPTNVLTFPFEPPPQVQSELLGDLVICAPLVQQEAAAQGKQLSAHWAHMVVHGVLHLLGFDHQDDREAEEMESLESALIKGFGYPDPYW